MASSTDATTCRAAVLVPWASDPRRVLCEASAAALTLPTVEVEAEPSTGSIQRAVQTLLGRPPVLLRANGVAWHQNWDTSAMFVEIEPVAGAAPDGLRWAEIGDGDASLVRPEWTAASVAGWLRERTQGYSPLRPQWSRRGWLQEAGDWMTAGMRRAGYREPGPPQFHYLWGISATLVADSRDGRAFLKASGDRFRHEGAVTRALAAGAPARLPDVLEVEAERGWMLMRDFGVGDLGEQPAQTWHPGLDALADLQLAWVGRGQELLELGAEDRSLAALASWVAATPHDDTLMGGLAEDARQEWLGTVSHYVDACERLDAAGVPHTLVHGDFHPGNVRVEGGQALVFDWTDAALAHPFVDLVTYVMRTPDLDVRSELATRYLARWQPMLTSSDGVLDLALVVGELYQAQSYAQLLPTVLPEDLSNLHGLDAVSLERAMKIRREGLAAGR